MAYTRAEALAYIAGEHAALLTEAGVGTTDSQAGVKSALDRAFRTLGVVEASLATASVDDTLSAKLEALLDYHTLMKVTRYLFRAVNVAKTTAGTAVQKNRREMYEQARQELDDSRENCVSLSLPVWDFK